MKELKEETVKNCVEKREYIFIELIKEKDSRQIVFLDEKGYKYKMSWETFKKGKNFKNISYSNPFSLYNAKLYIKLNNLPIILKSKEVKDVTTPLLFIGECGHEFYTSWNNIKKRKNFLCEKCQNINNGKIKKLDIERVKEKYEEKGLHLDLSKNETYKSNNTPLTCYDNNGYKFYIKLSNLFKYTGTVIVDNRNPYSLDNIKTYLKNINSETIVLSDEYKNEKQELLLKCKCGNEFKMSWSNIRGNEHICCKECYKKIKNEKARKRRLDYDTVYDMFKSKGFELLEKEYHNNSQRMLCRDKDGYKYLISYNSLLNDKIKTGEKYSIKHLPKNIIIYNLNNYAKVHNIKSFVLDILDESKYNQEEIKIKCECGEIYTAPLYSFISKVSRCPKCSKSISNLEMMVRNYLKSINIDFEQEKRFEDCRNILPLPFDFYIKDKNIIIECDGEGHYYPCNFNQCSDKQSLKTFESTKHNDKIKNEYCEKNNIKLIRIPYWDFKTDKWKEIINQWLI